MEGPTHLLSFLRNVHFTCYFFAIYMLIFKTCGEFKKHPMPCRLLLFSCHWVLCHLSIFRNAHVAVMDLRVRSPKQAFWPDVDVASCLPPMLF